MSSTEILTAIINKSRNSWDFFCQARDQDQDFCLKTKIKNIFVDERGKIHRVRKKTPPPPKHVKITLWIENDSQYFSLYHEKPSICKVYVIFHDN